MNLPILFAFQQAAEKVAEKATGAGDAKAAEKAVDPTLWDQISAQFVAVWSAIVLAATNSWAWLSEPTGRTVAAVVLGALGIWLMLPGSLGRVWLFAPVARWCGCREDAEGEPQYTGIFGIVANVLYFFTTLYGIGVLCALGCWVLLLSLLPTTSAEMMPVVFWILAGMTLASAVATITMQSPVYCAVWFGVTLLGTGGLFLIQGAQFLGVATVVVYAGAILVTFLFVLMLSQPEGHASYDRLSWGPGPTAFAALAGVALAALVVVQVAGVKPATAFTDPVAQAEYEQGKQLFEKKAISETELARLRAVASGDKLAQAKIEYEQGLKFVERKAITEKELARLKLAYERALGVQHPQHVAGLGGQMFSVHLVAIQVAGALLLAALVGAVAIAIQGKDPDRATDREAVHA